MMKKAPHSDILEADVLIVGGGLVGGLTACALAEGGVTSVVVDFEDPKEVLAAKFDGRASAISRSSYNAFQKLRLWVDMEPLAGSIDDIRVSDGQSLFFLHFDHKDVGDKPFGRMVENRVIRQALLKQIPDRPEITLLAPAKIADLERNPAHVKATLADGRTVKAKLVIGADGRGSWVRRHAGIKLTRWSYGQVGIVCTVEHEKPHQNVAQEHFLPAGPFAILPLPNNRSSIVWTEREKLAPYIMELSEEDFLAELKERFGDFLGEVRVVGPRWSYPLTLQFAQHSSATRLALVGDASHGMHPIAGQGFNMGARDACALAEILIETKRLGLDVGAGRVLDDYERWRRFDNHLMLAATDVLTKLFSNDDAVLKHARDLGLGLVNQIPPLKKIFTSAAMGMMGELPELMRD